MAARPRRLDESGRQPLDRPEEGHVVNFDATLGEQFFQIPLRQSVAVSKHGDQDDRGCDPEPCER